MQDDTQRHDAAAAPPHGAPQQPPPAPATSPAPAPSSESTVTPRGLEGLRAADPAPPPRPFDPIGSYGAGSAVREPLPFHTDLDSPLPFGYDHDPEHHEPMYLPLALSVGAGFKFGCGFMLAVAVSVFGLFLAASVIFFVAALAGLPVPGTTP